MELATVKRATVELATVELAEVIRLYLRFTHSFRFSYDSCT
jgi:hypothetical protein